MCKRAITLICICRQSFSLVLPFHPGVNLKNWPRFVVVVEVLVHVVVVIGVVVAIPVDSVRIKELLFDTD